MNDFVLKLEANNEKIPWVGIESFVSGIVRRIMPMGYNGFGGGELRGSL